MEITETLPRDTIVYIPMVFRLMHWDSYAAGVQKYRLNEDVTPPHANYCLVAPCDHYTSEILGKEPFTVPTRAIFTHPDDAFDEADRILASERQISPHSPKLKIVMTKQQAEFITKFDAAITRQPTTPPPINEDEQ